MVEDHEEYTQRMSAKWAELSSACQEQTALHNRHVEAVAKLESENQAKLEAAAKVVADTVQGASNKLTAKQKTSGAKNKDPAALQQLLNALL